MSVDIVVGGNGLMSTSVSLSVKSISVVVVVEEVCILLEEVIECLIIRHEAGLLMEGSGCDVLSLDT